MQTISIYLTRTRGSQRLTGNKKAPSLQQIKHVINAMPVNTQIEQRSPHVYSDSQIVVHQMTGQ